MSNNIITAVFEESTYGSNAEARTQPLWQYDYGQILKLSIDDLPLSYEVHFSTEKKGNSITVLGNGDGVAIPDELLLTGKAIYAWVYLHSTENDGETEYMVTIPVSKRAKPTNQEPTPVQQDVIDQTIAALQAAVAKSETNVEHYPCIINGYWYVWDAEQNAFVNTGVSGHGEKGDTGNGISRIELNPDYTLTFYYTNGTSYTTGNIRGAQGPQGEPGPKGDKGDKGDPGKPMDIIDDTAGAGETERAWSADKLVTELGTKADKTDTVLETTLSRGRKENTTVGQYSIAFGYDAEASGALSQAIGLYPTASGVASHAEGNSTTASGEHSHAEGSQSAAYGVRSHAEGYSTVATGPNSHAEGNGTSTAQGAQSAHAEGEWTQANAQASHAEGMGTRADGYYAHSEGDRTVAAGNYGHAEGSQTAADGTASHAEGYKATANGNYSHVEGDNTYASGQSSHAEGIRTEATGLGSHAEGYYSKSTGQHAHTEGARGDIASKMYNGVLYVVGASGDRSHAEGLGGIAAGTEAHAEGNGTYAIGNDSHAEGIETKAIGYSSHAEGSYTTAKAMHSHAEGYSTIASGNYSHVSGKHNVEDLNNQYVEIIGNGTGNATRSNARTLDWNGNEHLRGDIYVQCNPDGTGGIKIDPSGGGDVSNKADKTDTVLLTTLSRGRKENTTVGTASFAFGDNVTASGQASHAEGTGTVASALQAHAEGYGTTASGVNSHAEGLNTYASGAHAHTEGGGTSASGDYSHAEGAASQATSSTAHAEGSGTRASGGSSHAEGGGSVASGIYSHAEGAGTVASGSQAHAEGSGTQANGNHSHAEGQATKANAKESHAEGHYTVAAGEASHVFGKYNVADNYSDYPEWVSGTSYAVGDLVKVTKVVSGVTTVKGYKCYTANSDTTFDDYKWEQYDYLHYVEIVGNGEGPNEYASNARTLDWDGNERLMGDIYVGCNSDGTGGTNLRSAIQQKQDAPATAGTSGQVLGLNAQLEPEWKTVSGGGIVDSSLSEISENPVQNKVITNKIGQIVQDVHDPSTNFINYNDVGLGYIKSNGEAQTSGNWHNTGYVELEPGETYYWSGLYGSSAGYYAFYNSEKTAIYVGTSNLPNPFVPPAGTKYGRFSKNGDITSGVWISLTNSAPSNYGTMLDSSLLLRKNQGVKHSGKPMFVGADGNIEPSSKTLAETEVWKKGNLYKQSELVENKYIYKTGAESSSNGYYCTPFLPVSGSYVYVNNFLDTYYAFYDATKTLVASYDTLGDMTQWTPGIKRATIPSGAVYGRFSSHNLPASYAWISCEPENPPAEDQKSIKDVFPSTFNPDNPCDYESGSIGVFHKIVCIGDSLTSGVMNYDDGNLIDTPSSSTLAEWYSYPTQLTKMTGVQTTNMGDASETFKSWYELYGNTDFSGHDCAIIMLGVNDASFDKTDEETEEYLCAIIDALEASVMNIKIFVCTLTPVFSNDRFPTHKHKSQVIRDTLTDHYASDPNVILFDIEQYSHVTQYTSYAAGHFTAIGYWRFAKDVANFISWHIDNHLRDYRFVQFIGSDRTYTGD